MLMDLEYGRRMSGRRGKNDEEVLHPRRKVEKEGEEEDEDKMDFLAY